MIEETERVHCGTCRRGGVADVTFHAQQASNDPGLPKDQRT